MQTPSDDLSLIAAHGTTAFDNQFSQFVVAA